MIRQYFGKRATITDHYYIALETCWGGWYDHDLQPKDQASYEWTMYYGLILL